MERCEQMRGWRKVETANTAAEVASANDWDAGDTG